MLHFKGTLKVKWLSFWELWGTLLLLQGYKLLPNSTSKSVHECILQTRAATIIARRIWMAEPHTGLENMWSAVVSTGEALLLHQLHPTSTACCCSVSATLWDISCSQCRGDQEQIYLKTFRVFHCVIQSVSHCTAYLFLFIHCFYSALYISKCIYF